MIFKHEIENLNEDEIALLYYIVSKENTVPSNLEFINSIRKDYLLHYYIRNKNKFNDKGHEVYKSLIEKFTPNLKQKSLEI